MNTVLDWIIILFLLWIVFGCLTVILCILFQVLFESESIFSKVQSADLQLTKMIMTTGFVSFLTFICFCVTEYVAKRKKLKEIRERTPWWELKKFGGDV